MKRVLIFTGHFYPHIGGVEKVVYEISKRLTKIGFEIEIITSNPGKAPSREQIEEFYVCRLPSWNILGGDYPVPRPSLETIFILWETLNGRHDIIWTNTRFFLSSLLGLIIARLKRIPLIHLEHGAGHYVSSNKVVSLLGKVYDHTVGSLVIKSASKTTGVSNAACDFLKHLGAKETKVITLGVDTRIFQRKDTESIKKLVLKDETIILTFVGRLTFLKGVQDLLQSFQEIQKEVSNIELLIVGDGPYRRELERLAGDTDKILFMGEKSEAEVVDILNITDIFVSPSFAESFGLSMIEAGLIGIPIVAAANEAAREIIEDGRTGLLFRSGDVADLGEKIRRLIRDKKLRKTLGGNASLVFEQRFDWDKIVEKWARELSSIGKEPQ